MRQSKLCLLKGDTYTIPACVSLASGSKVTVKVYCTAAIVPHITLRNGRKIPANRLCKHIHVSKPTYNQLCLCVCVCVCIYASMHLPISRWSLTIHEDICVWSESPSPDNCWLHAQFSLSLASRMGQLWNGTETEPPDQWNQRWVIILAEE